MKRRNLLKTIVAALFAPKSKADGDSTDERIVEVSIGPGHDTMQDWEAALSGADVHSPGAA